MTDFNKTMIALDVAALYAEVIDRKDGECLLAETLSSEAITDCLYLYEVNVEGHWAEVDDYDADGPCWGSYSLIERGWVALNLTNNVEKADEISSLAYEMIEMNFEIHGSREEALDHALDL